MKSSKENEIKLFVAFLDGLNQLDGEKYFQNLIDAKNTVIHNIKSDWSWWIDIFETREDYHKLNDAKNAQQEDYENTVGNLEDQIGDLLKYDVRKINEELNELQNQQARLEKDRIIAENRTKALHSLLNK